MSNLEKLQALVAELKPEFDAIAAGDKAKDKIIRAVGKLSEDFDVEDTDGEDDLREEISDIAYAIDYSWNGNDEYETWELGERVEFWIPSTC